MSEHGFGSHERVPRRSCHAPVALASPDDIDRVIAATVKATEPMRKLAPYERQAVLQHCVVRFQEHFDELAMALCIEAGKPIKDSRGEVARLIDTFRVAAEEAVHALKAKC